MNIILLLGGYFVIAVILLYYFERYASNIKEFANNHKRKIYKILFTIIILLIISIVIVNRVRSNYIEIYNELIHTVATNSTTNIIILEYTGAELISNDSVGSDWRHSIKVEGITLNPYASSEIIELQKTLDDSMSLEIYTTEEDSVPDIDYFSDNISVKRMFNDQTFHLNMYVRENRGRYSNNIAHWRYNFMLYRKVDSEEVWEHMKNNFIKE